MRLWNALTRVFDSLYKILSAIYMVTITVALIVVLIRGDSQSTVVTTRTPAEGLAANTLLQPQLEPAPTPVPNPTITPAPTPTPTPTPDPTPTPSSTLAVSDKTVQEVRTTFRSLMKRAFEKESARDRDAQFEAVVDDAILHGQFDIAFEAAVSIEDDSKKSYMLTDVALCIAAETWYSRASVVATYIPNDYRRQSVEDKIFALEHDSLRGTPAPLCRQTNWLKIPDLE